MTTLQRTCLTLLMFIFSSSSFSGLMSLTEFNKLCQEGVGAVEDHLNLLKEEDPNGFPELIDEMLQGSRVNSGKNYLHQAILRTYDGYANQNNYSDAVEIVKLLLARGANPNTRCERFSFTPLHLATINRNEEVVRVLLRYGADPSLRDGLRRLTPQEYAQLQLTDSQTTSAEQQMDSQTTSAEHQSQYQAIIHAITEYTSVNQEEQQYMDPQPCEGAQCSLLHFPLSQHSCRLF